MTKKIMFNDKYCLTQAVLNKTKTMVRQKLIVPTTFEGKDVYGFNVLTNSLGTQCVDLLDKEGNVIGDWKPKYEVGEVVAIAQPYKDIIDSLPMYSGTVLDKNGLPNNRFKQGWNNRLFVEANLMPHHIKIIDVKVEYLKDITERECLQEGIGYHRYHDKVWSDESLWGYYTHKNDLLIFDTPHEAFISLIDKIMGNGTWESNPWVAAYSFELVD